jgi:tight adherence protein C
MFALLAGASVFLGMVGWLQLRRDPLEGVAAEDLAIISERGRRKLERPGLRDRVGPRLGRVLAQASGAHGRDWVGDVVERAGNPKGMTATRFFSDVGCYVLVLWSVGFVLLVGGAPWLVVGLCLLVPLAAPAYNIWAQARERQDRIDQDLPDLLDVLAVVVSAGIGFQSALSRVAERYGGPLADELQIVLRQIAVGESLRTALSAMRDRTRSSSVEQFVTALLQAEELGAPLAQTLNQIANDVRREASESAKRRATAAAPKATIVTILVLLPPTMAVLVYGVLTAVRTG